MLTRVAHYGDSSIATDLWTYDLRRALQQRFGDGGHGFVLISRGTMPYHHRDMRHRASGAWGLQEIVKQQSRDGFYGYGGVAYRPTGGAFASFGTDDRGPVGGAASRFLLYYLRQPQGGTIQLRVDEGAPELVSTAGEWGSGVHVVEVPDGPHELELRAHAGRLRLFGVALERDGPGVVYDSLGLVGARARRLLHYDPEHLNEQLELRDPHLVVLGFGGNEADDPIQRMPRYGPEYEEMLRLMRGDEQRPCLVLAPLDQAGRDRFGRIATMETVPLIVAAQRRAAARQGCAFFNTFEAMGGEGSMRRWAQARPRLGLTDYRHATPAGYAVLARMLYKALLKAFADHLREG